MPFQPHHVVTALIVCGVLCAIYKWFCNWLYRPMARPDFLSVCKVEPGRFPDQSGSPTTSPDYQMPRRDDGVMLTILAAGALVPNPSADDSGGVRSNQDGADRLAGLPKNNDPEPSVVGDSPTYGGGSE